MQRLKNVHTRHLSRRLPADKSQHLIASGRYHVFLPNLSTELNINTLRKGPYFTLLLLNWVLRLCSYILGIQSMLFISEILHTVSESSISRDQGRKGVTRDVGSVKAQFLSDPLSSTPFSPPKSIQLHL